MLLSDILIKKTKCAREELIQHYIKRTEAELCEAAENGHYSETIENRYIGGVKILNDVLKHFHNQGIRTEQKETVVEFNWEIITCKDIS
jgi:hypothetical protein